MIILVLAAGCTWNNSKKETTATTINEQKEVQGYQTAVIITPKITSTPTPRETSTPTAKITSTPTPRETSTPTAKITSKPTPRVTSTPSKTNYAQSSSNDAVSCPAGKCWVNPYTKKDGTKVRGYCRKC
jgi:hypothetical protein